MPAPAAPKPISLALQGGGAHGAFEWGIIDRLLEDGSVTIAAVTGASAGAMNAVALAAGLIEGGPAQARRKLEAFWRAISDLGGQNLFGDGQTWNANKALDWLKFTPGWVFASAWADSLSPYQFNPLNLNPMRGLLESQIDFAAIRAASPIALYVSATAVRAGASRIFRTAELTVDHILASTCLPHVFQAVVIDGEPYWDGGYLANPALWPLFYDPTPSDILLVNLNPFVREDTPNSAGEIIDRLNEITFNAPLVAELRAVAFVQKLIDEGLLKEEAKGRYRNMLIHAIGADHWLADLSLESKACTDWTFLTDLKSRGRRAAGEWLAKGLADVGVRSSIDVRSEFL
jgi:NTE family protein